MKKTITLLLLGFVTISSFSQKKDTTKIPNSSSPLLASYEAPNEMLKLLAPNVASMEKYGNLPINYSTGQLNYSLPLYQIEVDNYLKIPIQLSYSNSGLKPSEVPTWVGTGWNMFVGGTIVQYINGLDDFSANGLKNPSIRQDLSNYFNGSMNTATKYAYAKDVDDGIKDSQFDTFSFNFLGKSSKFYFDGINVHFFNYMPIKVAYNSNEFILTDEMGYQFIFGFSQISSGSFSDGFIYSNSDPFIIGSRTWYLTKITSPSGVETNFSYIPDIDYQITADGRSYWTGADGGQSGCVSSNQFNYQGSSSNTTVSQALVSEITWKGKKVTFETTLRNDLKDASDNKAKALSRITVYNESNQIVKKIGFEYGYFNNNDRLKLNNVSILENISTIKVATYSFEYYEKNGQNVPIPSLKISGGKNAENHAIDHWGYYNGKSNTSKIPRQNYSSVLPTSSVVFGDADKSADSSYSQIGLLKKIIYPTKGYTEIEYEANKVNYSSYNAIPFFLKNQNANSYTNFFTSSVVNCTLGSISGQITVNQAIVGAKITWTLETSSTDDNSRFTFKPTGSSTYIVNDFSQPYKQGILLTDLAVDTYDYTLEAGCVSMGGTPIAQASFKIDKPNTTNGGIDLQIGGNRVRRIIDYASPTGTNDRYIKYEQAALLSEPYYISSIEAGRGIGTGLNPCVSCGNKYFLTENNVYNWDGFHVEYKKITETYGLNAENGKRVYAYLGNYYVGGPISNSPYPSTFNLNWRSGNLANQEVFEKSGANFNSVQKSINTYTTESYFPITKNGLKVGKKLACPQGSAPQQLDDANYNYALMPTFTDKYGIQATSNIEYFNGLDLSNTVTYTYNNDWLLSKTSTTNSRNQTEELLTYYANDYNNLTNANVATLKTKNIIGMPLKIVKTINGNAIEGVLLKSDAFGNPIEIYSYQQNALIPHSHSANTYFDPNFSLFDSRKYSSQGNLIESVSRRRSPVTYIWAYKHAYPIATVVNATNSQVESIIGSLESVADLYNDNDLLNIGNSLRSGLPNAQVNSGLIASGIGLKQLTTPNGLKSTYQFDAINRLITIKDNQENIADKFTYRYADGSPSGCSTSAPPSISVSSASLCTITLAASGCVGTINWSNGSIGNSINIDTKNTTVYTATCTVAGCTSNASNILTMPSLPTGWTAQQIGTPPVNGCVQESGGTWTIRGSGNTFNSSDQINYVYKTHSGNAVIVAKINSISASAGGTRSGVMLRSSTSPTADYFQFFFDRGNQVLSLYEQNSSNGDQQLGYQATTIPSWIRLKKEGTTISVWYSQNASPAWNNDADWTLYTNVTSSLFNGSYLLGILAYNNDYSSNSLMNETQFTNVSTYSF